MLPQLGEMLSHGGAGHCGSVHVGLHHRHPGGHHVLRPGDWPICQSARPKAAADVGFRCASRSAQILYTLTHNTESLIAIQLLDGVANAIFGVVSILVVADQNPRHGPVQSCPRRSCNRSWARRGSQHYVWRKTDSALQLSHLFLVSGSHRCACICLVMDGRFQRRFRAAPRTG